MFSHIKDIDQVNFLKIEVRFTDVALKQWTALPSSLLMGTVDQEQHSTASSPIRLIHLIYIKVLIYFTNWEVFRRGRFSTKCLKSSQVLHRTGTFWRNCTSCGRTIGVRSGGEREQQMKPTGPELYDLLFLKLHGCHVPVLLCVKFLIFLFHVLVVWTDDRDLGDEPWGPYEGSSNNAAKFGDRQCSGNTQETGHR